MKCFVFCLCFSISSLFSYGTVCVDKTFQYENLNLYLCQNHSNYNETTTLLYKARAQQLNKLIGDLVKAGKLKGKKFEIQIWDIALTYDHLMLTQSKNGYHVSIAGFPSLETLSRIVNYFAQPSWESFTYDPNKIKTGQEPRRIIEKIIDEQPQIDITPYLSEKIKLWKLDDISLQYVNDEVTYFEDDIKLPYKPTRNLPVKIKDRFLFFETNNLFLYKKGRTLLKFSMNYKGTGEDFSLINVHSNWVNIGFSPDHYLYAYSYEENKVYNLIK